MLPIYLAKTQRYAQIKLARTWKYGAATISYNFRLLSIARISYLSSRAVRNQHIALNLFGGSIGGFIDRPQGIYKSSHLQLKQHLVVAYTLFTRYWALYY
jgi:hypothetical protein